MQKSRQLVQQAKISTAAGMDLIKRELCEIHERLNNGIHSPDRLFYSWIFCKDNLNVSLTQSSRAMFWKFSQMPFAKLDNDGNLTISIGQTYLIKPFFAVVHISRLKLSGL
jgi:hypothetical protein